MRMPVHALIFKLKAWPGLATTRASESESPSSAEAGLHWPARRHHDHHDGDHAGLAPSLLQFMPVQARIRCGPRFSCRQHWQRQSFSIASGSVLTGLPVLVMFLLRYTSVRELVY